MDLKTWLSETNTSQSALAEPLRVTQSAVSQWLASRVPAERVLDVERATGGAVTRFELRADLYGDAPEGWTSPFAGQNEAREPERLHAVG